MWKQNNTDEANNCRVWSMDHTWVPMTVSSPSLLPPPSSLCHTPPPLLPCCFSSSLLPTHCPSLNLILSSSSPSSLPLVLYLPIASPYASSFCFPLLLPFFTPLSLCQRCEEEYCNSWVVKWDCNLRIQTSTSAFICPVVVPLCKTLMDYYLHVLFCMYDLWPLRGGKRKCCRKKGSSLSPSLSFEYLKVCSSWSVHQFQMWSNLIV